MVLKRYSSMVCDDLQKIQFVLRERSPVLLVIDVDDPERLVAEQDGDEMKERVL